MNINQNKFHPNSVFEEHKYRRRGRGDTHLNSISITGGQADCSGPFMSECVFLQDKIEEN